MSPDKAACAAVEAADLRAALDDAAVGMLECELPAQLTRRYRRISVVGT